VRQALHGKISELAAGERRRDPELYRRLIAARAALENEFAQAENQRGELVRVSAKVLEKLIDRLGDSASPVPPVQTGPTVSERMQSSKTVAVTKASPDFRKPADLASDGSWKHNRRAMGHQAGGLCKHYLCRRGGLGCYRGRTSSALGDHAGRQAGQLDDRLRRQCPELATASGTGKPAVAVWAYRWRTGFSPSVSARATAPPVPAAVGHGKASPDL
jgi:hypothetical protein